MARRNSEEVVESTEETVEIPESVPETDEKGQVAVHSAIGTYVRTYSVKEHGRGYKKLAEMYAGKIGGSVR